VLPKGYNAYVTVFYVIAGTLYKQNPQLQHAQKQRPVPGLASLHLTCGPTASVHALMAAPMALLGGCALCVPPCFQNWSHLQGLCS
jgi:hypothetical protein